MPFLGVSIPFPLLWKDPCAPSLPCRPPLLLPARIREQGAASLGKRSPEPDRRCIPCSCAWAGLRLCCSSREKAAAGPGAEPGRDAAFLGKQELQADGSQPPGV